MKTDRRFINKHSIVSVTRDPEIIQRLIKDLGMEIEFREKCAAGGQHVIQGTVEQFGKVSAGILFVQDPPVLVYGSAKPKWAAKLGEDIQAIFKLEFPG